MNNDKTAYGVSKNDLLLPVRAAVMGFPIALIAVAFLWITDYPPEQWPFIAGVLVICLFASAMLLQYSTLFVARLVNRYGRRVLLQRDIDPDVPEPADSNRRSIRLLYAVVVFLLLTGAVWGVALNILTLVMARLELPPFVDGFGAVAYTLLGVGLGGLVLAFGIPAAVFYLASDDSSRLSRAVTRARAGALSALLGVEQGVPFYGGQGLSGLRLRN